MVHRFVLKTFPCVTFTAVLFALVVVACDENKDDGDGEKTDACAQVDCFAHASCNEADGNCQCDAGYADWVAGEGCSLDPLVIIGSFDDQYGMHYEVAHDVWTLIGYGTVSRFFVAQHSNRERFLIAHNASNNEYSPGLWSRFDWVEYDDTAGSGAALWVCQTIYDADSEATALATAAADSNDPATGGCGGGSWSKLSAADPTLSIIGSYGDAYGGSHWVSPSLWTFGGFGNTSYFHITRYSSVDRFVIAHNNSHNSYNPRQWSRFDWTWHDDSLFICQSAYGAASEADAVATTAPDASDPTTGGCWGFSWSEFVAVEPAWILSGEWTDAQDGHFTLTHDGWSRWVPYSPANTHRYVLSQLSNEEGWVIAHNHRDNPTGAELWSRLDWTWYDAGNGNGLEVWTCHTVADASSESDALAATPADASDPSTGGCGAAAWSRFVPWVAPPCKVPRALALPVVHQGATVTFVTDPDAMGTLEVGVGSVTAVAPQAWNVTSSVELGQVGGIKVFAKLVDDLCASVPFVHAYDVRTAYPPAAGVQGTTAIAADSEAIVGWATGVASVNFGSEVDEAWQFSDKALGAATGASDIVALGRGGDITLTFAAPIVDGDGYDLAVFENSFAADFLELAWVEVSSDGVTFLRLDNAYLGNSPLGPFDTHDTGLIGSLAGKYEAGFGTPFDLSTLANRPEVIAGAVDLAAIAYVRIVDIVGDGNAFDSFGHVIYDPYPTTGSAGFDLDAVAALHH